MLVLALLIWCQHNLMCRRSHCDMGMYIVPYRNGKTRHVTAPRVTRKAVPPSAVLRACAVLVEGRLATFIHDAIGCCCSAAAPRRLRAATPSHASVAVRVDDDSCCRLQRSRVATRRLLGGASQL